MPAVLLTAGFAASQFWTLQTLVYLHLRWAIDRVGAEEIADRSSQGAFQTPMSEGEAAEPSGGPAVPIRLRATLLALGAVVGSWCLTYWLFTRVSSGPTEWLGWGLGETLIPPAEGVYQVASLIAGVWVVVWLVSPLVLWVVIQRRTDPASRDEEAQEPSRG